MTTLLNIKSLWHSYSVNSEDKTMAVDSAIIPTFGREQYNLDFREVREI